MFLFFLLALARVQGNPIGRNETTSSPELGYTKPHRPITESAFNVSAGPSNCTEQTTARVEKQPKPDNMFLFRFIYKELQNMPSNQNVTEIRKYSMEADGTLPQELSTVDSMYYQSPRKWLAFKNSSKMNFLRELPHPDINTDQNNPFDQGQANQSYGSVPNYYQGTEIFTKWNRSGKTYLIAELKKHNMLNMPRRNHNRFGAEISAPGNFTALAPSAESNIRVKRQDGENKLKIVQEVYSTLLIGKAYVAKKYHYFRKEVPFEQMFSELTSLNINLRNMNPTGVDSSFREIQGKSAKFLQTKLPRSFAQNSLICAEVAGSVIGWNTIVSENIPILSKTATSDTL
jgi:hypothetical protein